MTIMGLDYLKHKETQRSNLANERETHRSNLANETERNRSNLANEAETHRSNLAREAETNRSNVARELETNRSNLQNELLRDKELAIKLKDVEEKVRHNQRGEDLDSLKISLSALPTSVKSIVGTQLAKKDPTLGAIWNEKVEQGKAFTNDIVSEARSKLPDIFDKLLNPIKPPIVFRNDRKSEFAFGNGRTF